MPLLKFVVTNKKMKKVIFYICAFILLSGCAQQYLNTHLPIVKMPTKAFQVNNLTKKQQSLLMIQFQPNHWRFIQTNALGAPIARMVLTNKGWRNDGFIMPNSQSKLLFTALINDLYPQENFFNIQQKNGVFYWGKTHWQVQHNKNIEINFTNMQYQLTTMEFK